MDNNILSTIRASKGFSRSVVMLITLALLGVMLERTIYYGLNESGIIEDENVAERVKRIVPHEARKLGLTQQAVIKQNVQKIKAENQLARTVQDIKEKLSTLDSPYLIVDVEQLAAQIAAMRHGLESLNLKVKENFEKNADHIEQYNLSDVIAQRHNEAVAQYDEKFKILKHKLIAIDLAQTLDDKKTKLNEAKNWLSQQQFKRQQQAFDPDNLPFNAAQPNKENKPRLNKQSFTKNGYFDSPSPQLAALGDFTFDNLSGASDPAYLASSDEVVLSQSIKDLAATLSYDTVEIYHWVRNNIQWQPTWGAVQNAELTLAAKRGNAMDIASLTIALLRASEIPARYVHGTIDVLEADFRNWAGGFSNIDAATAFASAGGIPTIAISRAGKVHRVRIEHVWVEVATDYHPSRAAVNIDADSWIAIDPGYKQYDYLSGLDVAQISGIDTDQLAQDVVNSGTINEQEGWITGFDPTLLQAAQTQAQTALEDHITNNLIDPTVGDVIGGRKTIIQQYPVLAASLANDVIVSGARYDKLPASLQQSVRYTFANSGHTTSFSWSKVNNEKLTLSFKPATEDDEAALQSLLPEGEITDISQLPNSIPAYLINVVPELKLNGELKLTGAPIPLGEGLDFKTQITQPGRIANINYNYNIPAGSFVSVNTIAGNVSSEKLTQLQTQLEQTKATLETNDTAQIENLSREDILGDMFYTGTLGYFAQLIGLSRIGALQADAQFYLSAGYGTFGYEPNVDYYFGIPQAIQAGGVTLDIPLMLATANNAGDKEKEKQFVLQSGVLSSALEHITPEQLFNTDPDNPANAFSAVKALQLASAQGQRIYQISQANINDVMPNLNLDSLTKDEIQSAVNMGKEVIAHTDLVSVPGYGGAGYVIVDPVTGAGAYKISGGGNGGFKSILKKSISLFSLTATGPIALALSIAGFIDTIVTLLNIIEDCANSSQSLNVFFGSSFGALLALSAVTLGAVAFVVVGLPPGVGLLAATLIVNQATSFVTSQYKDFAGCN